MVELKPGVPVYGLLQQMTQLRNKLGNSQSAFDATDGPRYFLTSLEAIESTFSHNFQRQDWASLCRLPSRSIIWHAGQLSS